jgi:hypothetical protein
MVNSKKYSPAVIHSLDVEPQLLCTCIPKHMVRICFCLSKKMSYGADDPAGQITVGLMVSMSSPLNFLTIVVLPALSKPLRANPHDVGDKSRMHLDLALGHSVRPNTRNLWQCELWDEFEIARMEEEGSAYTIRIRISLSFCRTFFKMLKRPILRNGYQTKKRRKDLSTKGPVSDAVYPRSLLENIFKKICFSLETM